MRKGRMDTVADGLLDLVLDGTYGPGSSLPSEAELADRFGVSRLTVREAIRSLASTQVIDVRQGKSSVINPVDRWSPLDPRLLSARGEVSGQPLVLPKRLLEARRTVEAAIAELAAERRSDEQVAQMSVFLERMRQAHRETDLTRFVEADLAFHHVLFEAVDNPFLDALFEPLALVLRTLRRETSSVPQIRAHAITWHGKILEKIADGDPNGAREAMRGHLVQTERDTERYLGDRQAAHAALGVGS
jgi:GntR family transcriptional repressor for pyruvate dehydrogenase complex